MRDEMIEVIRKQKRKRTSPRGKEIENAKIRVRTRKKIANEARNPVEQSKAVANPRIKRRIGIETTRNEATGVKVVVLKGNEVNKQVTILTRVTMIALLLLSNHLP